MDNNTLFYEERQNEILKLLKVQKKLLVPELAKRFDVSQATIRNDLNDLAEKGLLTRTHGGAIVCSKTGFEQLTNQKLDSNMDIKKKIAVLAAESVNDGDTIAIDVGSTTYEFANELLGKKDLTVITPDLTIALLLEDSANVILAGGNIRKGHHCCVGAFASDMLDKLAVDKSYLATNGASAAHGFSTPDVSQAEIKRKLIKAGTQVYMLADGSKFEKDCCVSFADYKDIDIVVTDEGLPQAARLELEKSETEILFV